MPTKRQRIQAQGHVGAKSDKRIRTEHADQTTASVIDKLYQQGSARIRFPNTEASTLHAVLLNTAGGLTGDDCIEWSATAGTGSHLCISTAACEKIYRTHGPAALQNTVLKVAADARLEWLPQESILFNGSYLNRSLRVEIDESAEALIVESLVLGRQAMDEPIDTIHVQDRWRIHRGNRLLHAEDFRLDMGSGITAHRRCILHQYRAISTLVLVTNQQQEWCDVMLHRLREFSENSSEHIRAGASTLPSRIVVRVLATNSFHLRKFLIPCIQLLNDERPVPSVWNV